MIPSADSVFWSDYLRRTLQNYAEPLLRQVAARLFKPRNQWPAEELIERSIATFENAAVVDRRLQDLDLPARRLLACIGHSRQPRWRLANLLELLAALGCAEGPEAVFRMFEAGLLYPDVLAPAREQSTAPAARNPLGSFEEWLGQGSVARFAVFAHPLVTGRALGTDLGLPVCATASLVRSGIHEADGLDWPLRLAALWQRVEESPLRRTQQGDFFKRDHDRLQNEPLLGAPPVDALAELPDAGFLTVSLGLNEGLVVAEQEELRAGTLPLSWDEGLSAALASLWANLPWVESWNPRDGWCGPAAVNNPYPSAYLLLLLLLANLSEDAWAEPTHLEQWLLEHHPYWTGGDRRMRSAERQARKADSSAPAAPPTSTWISTFLLGFAYQLRMVQAAKDSNGQWLVRLSPLGRWLLGIQGPPALAVPFAQTLLTQPNLEIIVYRQALTPGLIARLSRFATWKNFGSACTLQVEAHSVYRALENGLTFEMVVQTLEQHGMRPTPPAVIESLRTWADKRDRISVYPSATLFEFADPADLNEALARGFKKGDVPSVLKAAVPFFALSDRMLIVVDEQTVDFRHFRLLGTRDYALPPEKCVGVDADGVTLSVDVARSDLLLELELQRFAEPLGGPGVNGKHRYRLTPASLAGSRDSGLGVRELDDWFSQRSGQPLSAAARLLLSGSQTPPPALRPQLVLHVATAELADGLLQWPGTRALIRERLGPTALVVAEEDVALLQERLETIGVKISP
jgi:Helicase conserved C-terminal domain